MDIEDRTVLILGGAGLVGRAVCKALLPFRPSNLIVAARREETAQRALGDLRALGSTGETRLLMAAGDIFERAEPSGARPDINSAERSTKQRRIDDMLAPLDEDIMTSSFLARLITGRVSGLEETPADIVIDCVNTATAVSYRNLYSAAKNLADLARLGDPAVAWQESAEAVLSSLYLPQLVRHIQILYQAMRQAGTEAYLKVGTSGTGGMGFDIPYTHGEERPSRLLLSKAAIAGAQSALIFLMARSAGGPRIVKELKPAALIGWQRIAHGPIQDHGRDIALYDCPYEQAVSVDEPENLIPKGDFGRAVGGVLEGVFIDTGENGVFSADEFAAITAPGQMEMVTPEEIAENAVRELTGVNSGHDVVGALDGAVMGPSYRGGHLRRAASNLLHALEAEHGRSTAFEILGPPRLAKLLFEVEVLRRTCGAVQAIQDMNPQEIATASSRLLRQDRELRQRILSIGIPILLADGKQLLRGPKIKSEDAYHGWVDLRPENMALWQRRMKAIGDLVARETSGDTSSTADRVQAPSQHWRPFTDQLNAGEIVAWIFSVEDQGRRLKR